MNEIIDANRRNKFVGARAKKDAMRIVGHYIRYYAIKATNHPVFIKVKWVEPNKRRDLDNVVSGGMKVILDSLVQEGILKDDGWKYVVGFQHTFGVDKDDPCIIVELEEEE